MVSLLCHFISQNSEQIIIKALLCQIYIYRLYTYIIVSDCKSNYCHFNHTILLVLKNAISFINLTQWETMSDEWSGVNLSGFNKAKDFLAIATIYTAILEGEILSIHFW